jgi:hypothetical protein
MPSEIFGVDGLVVLLFPVCFVLALWALIDAAIRPSQVFQAAGQNKTSGLSCRSWGCSCSSSSAVCSASSI